MCSCGPGNSKKGQAVFQPSSTTPQIEVNVQTSTQDVDYAKGSIKMAVMIQNGLSDDLTILLEGRMKNIAAKNNVATDGANPAIVLAPTLVEIKRDITATVPPKHTVEYEFSLYVANVVTGDIYATKQMQLVGVGDSDELASKNAVTSIAPGDAVYADFIRTAEDKVVSYYEKNGDQLISDALSMSSRNEFDQALLILNSFPEGCSLYSKAIDARNTVLDAFFVANGEMLVAQMKKALRTPKNNDEGFSEEFLALYVMVPTTSPAKKEADALYAEYCKQADAALKQKLENKQREWEKSLADSESIRNNELEMYKAKLAADVAIDGQTALLNKYKSDHDYSKLGKFWKFFYVNIDNVTEKLKQE